MGFLMNIIPSFAAYSIAFKIANTPRMVCFAYVIINFCHQFVEGLLSSFIIQQARGVFRGQADLQSYKFVIMGFSGAIGSLFGTILITYEATRYVFVVKGTIYLFSAI